MSKQERIVLRNISKPESTRSEDLLKLFCIAFNFSDDKKSTESMLFREITFSNFEGSGVTSKNLNKKLMIPRSTIIYHLNRFMSTGFVIRRGRRYYLRSSTMASTIEEIQFDMEKEFGRLIKYAEMLDKNLEIDANDTRRPRERKIAKPKKQ